MFSRTVAILILLLVTMLEPRVLAQSQGELVDGIAAVVNGEVITLSQVRELVAARERILRSSFRGQELVDKIKEARLAALKDLIDRQLILQAFKKEGLSIPDRIIDQRIEALIKEEFGGDREAFIRTLQAQGYTLSKFRELERDKTIVQAMRQRHANPNLLISPQRVEAYYNANKSKYTTPEQVKLRMIVISGVHLDTNTTPESQKAIAEEIRSKIVAGAEFERMAQMYSDDPTRDSGGDWGWIDRTTLNEELTNIAFKLKAGEVSEVFEMGGSYYILYVEARKNATARPLSELREEIERQLLQEERIAQQEKWIDSLRAKAFIKMF